MTEGNASEPGREKEGCWEVAVAGIGKGVGVVGWSGWWTEAAFGSVWLAVIGVHSSRSPAVMTDRMTLSTFPLPSIMCVCVSMSEWRQTHLGGHTTGDGDADNVHRGCVCVWAAKG